MPGDRSPHEAAPHGAAPDEDVAPEDDAEPARPNLIDRTADRVDAIQRRIPPVAIVFAVTKKYGEDRGGQLAMLLAYKGFFSLFPLLLAFVTLLGLLLSGNPELRDDLINSTLASIPVVGTEVISDTGQIDGSVLVLVGAVLVSLWAGLGLLDMLQEALNTVWDVVQHERPPWIIRRLRDVPGAILIALCAIASGAGRWLLADGASDALRWIVAALLAVLAGAAAYLGLHLLLCARSVPMRSHLPGAIATGLGWWGLQALGGWYVTRFVRDSSDTYGVFVVVLGLLSWTYLLGMMYLYSVELAAVLHERRWPRSLSGRDLTDADLAAFGALSEREARVPGTEIDVTVPRDPQ
ncbi:MAG: YihY/virulence factor BrkB family protein [Microthrixaceae bacterium]